MKTVNSPVRVRFAPSPTGHLHIGGLRAAFFNWLFARHYHGTFLLRIEDTDLERSQQAYTDSILQAFAWAKLEPDEPVVIQSQRFEQHAQVIQQLLAQKKAYRCYCPQTKQPESSDDQTSYTKYDRACRLKTDTDKTGSYVVRFAVPDNVEYIEFDDLIRGRVSWPIQEIDDFIIARSDGRPVYNFVVVVDDAFMRITHVLRGEDHISNTPKQILLYQACGYSLPEFGHLPMILGSSGQRLSKRDAATSVLDYKDNGYLPDALLNYLVRLGWAHGDQEIFTRHELVDYFSLDHVGKKGAIFDQHKLDWMNSMYMRACSQEQLIEYMRNNLAPELVQQLSVWNEQQLSILVKLYKERTKTLRELAQEIGALAHVPTGYIEADVVKTTGPSTVDYLNELLQILDVMDTFTVEMLTEAINTLCKKLGIKLVALAQPIRLALVGKTTSPGVFDLLALLGKKEGIKRIRIFKEYMLTRYQ